MNPELELARKAGRLSELECYNQLYLESKFYVGVLSLIFVLVLAIGTFSGSENAQKFAAMIAVLNALFVLSGIYAKFRGVPRILRECERRLSEAESNGSLEATLIRTYLGVTKKKMLDEGFRTIKRSKKAVHRNPDTEVLGRGYYQQDATASAEEFAVLLHGTTIAMSRVIAIDADAIWEPGQNNRFEGGSIAGHIFGAVARSRVGSQMGEGEGPPLEVVCVGLQSSTEPSDFKPHWESSLSSTRARNLVNAMSSKSLTWHGSHNLRIIGLDLGKSLVEKSFGGEPERRQRSGVIVFLTRDLSYERVFSFDSAVGEILSVSAINGTMLSAYEHSHDLRDRIIVESARTFPSTAEELND